MKDNNRWLTVGELVAPQGLKGKIRIKPSSDFPERFTKPGKRWLQKETEDPIEIELIDGNQIPGKSLYIITFVGINNRHAATELIGYRMMVESNDRPTLQANEFHLLDLMDLEVKLFKTKESIGKVTNLISGGNDLLEVKLTSGKKILIPFVKEIVPEIKLKEKCLWITPPPGLLEL